MFAVAANDCGESATRVDPANKDEVLALMDKAGDFELPQSYKDAYTVENAPGYRGRDGGFKPADMDRLVAEQKKIGVIAKDVDWRKYIDLTALWRAQKNLKLPLDPAPGAVRTGE